MKGEEEITREVRTLMEKKTKSAPPGEDEYKQSNNRLDAGCYKE